MMDQRRLTAEPERQALEVGRRCQGHELQLYQASDPRRAELESFVRDVFASKHGASVCSFMPTLLAMRNDVGAVCSVAGFRRADEQSLFLERYLDQPVEHAIGAAAREQVSRSQIVEVGNLAGANCRSAMRLVLELPRMLLDSGHRWIVFTATDTLRHLLASYHAPLLDLAAATPARVQNTGDEWGRYYDSQPRIMAGYLPDGLSLCRRRGK
jgi:hypothetical protein